MSAALFLFLHATAATPTLADPVDPVVTGERVVAFATDGRCALLALTGPTFTLVCEDAAPVSVSATGCPTEARALGDALRARGVVATVDPAACGTGNLVTAPPLTRPDAGATLEVGELTVRVGRASPNYTRVDPRWMAVRAVADTQLVVVLLAPTQAEAQRSASIQGVYVARDGRTMRIWEPKAR